MFFVCKHTDRVHTDEPLVFDSVQSLPEMTHTAPEAFPEGGTQPVEHLHMYTDRVDTDGWPDRNSVWRWVRSHRTVQAGDPVVGWETLCVWWSP